MTNDKGS